MIDYIVKEVYLCKFSIRSLAIVQKPGEGSGGLYLLIGIIIVIVFLIYTFLNNKEQ